MTIRVRDKTRPGDDSKDIACGPAHAQRSPFLAMRRTIDESIVFAAARGHDVGRKPR